MSILRRTTTPINSRQVTRIGKGSDLPNKRSIPRMSQIAAALLEQFVEPFLGVLIDTGQRNPFSPEPWFRQGYQQTLNRCLFVGQVRETCIDQVSAWQPQFFKARQPEPMSDPSRNPSPASHRLPPGRCHSRGALPAAVASPPHKFSSDVIWQSHGRKIYLGGKHVKTVFPYNPPWARLWKASASLPRQCHSITCLPKYIFL